MLLLIIYQTQLRSSQALAYYRQALDIARREKIKTQEIVCLINIGNVYLDINEDKALEYYQQAMNVAIEIKYPEAKRAILQNIGYIYLRQGHYDTALECFQQAREIARELGVSELWHLYAIGNIFHAQGLHDEPLEVYWQVLESAKQENDLEMEMMVLFSIGSVYQERETYAQALAMYQQGLDIALELRGGRGKAEFLAAIADIYQAQGNFNEALEAYEQVMNTFETTRVALVSSQQWRIAFEGQRTWGYESAVNLFHQQGYNEEAFLTSERARARVFLDSLDVHQVILTDDELASELITGVPNTAWLADQVTDEEGADLLAREFETYLRCQTLLKALGEARASGSPGQNLADLEIRLEEAEAAHTEALTAVRAYGGQVAALVPGRSTILGVSDVQALLDEQTTLLSYFVLEDQILIFVITRTNFIVTEAQIPRQTLNTQIGGFREFIENRQPEVRQWSQRLYQELIIPISDSLHTPRLIIVPHGSLHYLPFAALQNPDTNQYLVEQYALTILPSASTLPFIQQNMVGRKLTSPLVLGDPTSDLDSAKQEAQLIADLYNVEPLLGEAATESAVWEQIAQAGILHLAAHAEYNPTTPLFSGIVLASDNSNDGRLEVHEVYGLDLNQTDLVVLSACQTQLGKLSAGDEMVGLVRAFLFAGTPTVVATLWNVDDVASSELMVQFHTYLQQGMSRTAALRQAQLDLLQEERYAAPYYWSGFVLSGYERLSIESK